jgi:plastocyanin
LRPNPVLRLWALCFALLSLAACGRGPATPPPPPAATHTVTIEGMRFSPEALTVRPGDTVVWVNKDLFAHTATASSAGFDSREIASGQSWSHKLQSAGDFPYICTFHPTMKARVRVE